MIDDSILPWHRLRRFIVFRINIPLRCGRLGITPEIYCLERPTTISFVIESLAPCTTNIKSWDLYHMTITICTLKLFTRKPLKESWGDVGGLVSNPNARGWINHSQVWIMRLITKKKRPPCLAGDIFKLFSLQKIIVFRFKFRWNFFHRGLNNCNSVIQHLFGYWLGVEQATSHYLNQWWLSLLTHICFTRPQWINQAFPKHTDTYETVWRYENITQRKYAVPWWMTTL